jgi:hypothetical protein
LRKLLDLVGQILRVRDCSEYIRLRSKSGRDKNRRAAKPAMVVANSATRRADNIRRERNGLPFINTSPNSVRRLSAEGAPDGPALSNAKMGRQALRPTVGGIKTL